MIAREGHRPFFASLLVAGIVHAQFGVYAALPLWGMVGFIAYLFRDPARKIPALPLAIVSPVDGSIGSVRSVHDPWLERDVQRVGIHLPLLGISPLRSPTEGKVVDHRYRNTAFQEDDFFVSPRGTVICHTLWIQTDEGDNIVLVVSSRWRFHRFKFNVQVGERIGQGRRCGFVWFGSRVDILVPDAVRLEVESGERIAAGSGVVATLVHD